MLFYLNVAVSLAGSSTIKEEKQADTDGAASTGTGKNICVQVGMQYRIQVLVLVYIGTHVHVLPVFVCMVVPLCSEFNVCWLYAPMFVSTYHVLIYVMNT